MEYKKIVQGQFISRPNRFIAQVLVEGQQETVHVKNTGRCLELLTPGATVYLEENALEKRKTKYDLVAVEKGSRLINMDSQAPNKAVHEWLLSGADGAIPGILAVKPEVTWGSSRFDFYIETTNGPAYLEVKGVTRELDGITCFPDAPSERAIKHLEELTALAAREKLPAYVLFVIQMEDVKYFTPDRERHPEFAGALENAARSGVQLLAYDCHVTPQSMTLRKPVQVYLRAPLGELLLPWYRENKRQLPWREQKSAYGTWVSEIMLQQTRVEAVKEYYKRFMEALPTIEALANAPEEQLLKLWEGLGYYNRIRNMQRAARLVMEKHHGQLPRTYEEIIELPGIGSYTAGAIGSIAYELPVPAVDGNVMRVYSRIYADDRNISDPRVKSAIEEELLGELPKNFPGEFNQALMELGACICLPNGAPKCEVCPVQELCQAHIQGRELEFPVKEKRKQRTIEKMTVLLIQDADGIAIRKRPEKGLLAGLYEFPHIEGHCTKGQVIEQLKEWGLSPIRLKALPQGKHIFTHKEWHMKGFYVRVDELADSQAAESQNWIYAKTSEIQEHYPIPSAFELYTDYLSIRQGKKRYL